MKRKLLVLLLFSTVPAAIYAETLADSATIKPFADLLVWRASETNSNWSMTLSFPGNTVDVVQSRPNFDTNSGVRAGLSYSPGDHYLDTKLYYTYYSTNSKNSVSLGSQIVSSLFFSGSYFISNNLFFGGSANWGITMNMLDFEMSHSFRPSDTLSLTPRIGIKGATIDQSINLNWNAVFYQSTEKLTNNFTGAGPSYGLNANLKLIGDLSLVGDISSAMMYGKWSDSDVYFRPASLVTTQTTISSSATSSKLGTFMMDYYLGLEWHHHGRSDVAVRLGYETQYWPTQLRLVAVQQLPTLGDLTFQGATCNVTIAL